MCRFRRIVRRGCYQFNIKDENEEMSGTQSLIEFSLNQQRLSKSTHYRHYHDTKLQRVKRTYV